MTIHALLVCSAFLHGVLARDLKFPPGFLFGAASAAYQIEGGWNVSDKGESIWDRFSHSTPSLIADGTTGDVAGDSYHLWRRDVEIASELGLNFYRFSLSWSRLLPSGYLDHISEDGSSYYNRIIDELLARNIEPFVTIYHWDLPQRLQDLGGWTNPLVSEWFEDYAKVVFSLYADRVKTWVTVNEPLVSCQLAYNTGILAPGITDPHVGAYLCTKHALIAHAKAWRVYDEQYKSKYGGKVSISNQYVWYEGLTDKDEGLAQLANELANGLVSHPVYSKAGGWPPQIESIIADNSKREGYTTSRLPNFTKAEIALVRGTYDYIAFNHYTSRVVSRANDSEKLGPWPIEGAPELGAKLSRRDTWKMGTGTMFPIYPEGFRKMISWFKQQYGDVNIIVTENGYSSPGSELNDDDRVEYYKDYLEQLLLAIKEDGANVTGYTAWTLMDNFEWMDGYRTKFGLYEVDFKHSNRTRTPRKSALYYSSVIKHHSLDVPDIPDIVINNKALRLHTNWINVVNCILLLLYSCV